ncbi:hypothetical protein D4R54_00480 [archaeon]|nr:MAG: hypothetical protein D4R54_00480 [archaeon]
MLIASAGLYSIILLIVVESATASIQFVLAFLLVTALIPISMSIGASLYLSSFGETRILHIWDMNLVTIPITVVVLLAVYYHDLGTFAVLSFLLTLYIFFFGLIHDAIAHPFLGVSGGPSKAIREIMSCNVSHAVLTQYLDDPQIADHLQMDRIEKIQVFGFETDKGQGFVGFVFALPDPKNVRRSILLFIGYELTPFEILPNALARHSITNIQASLIWFLGDRITFNRPQDLDSFIRDYPKFRYSSSEAVEYALRPTKIPLMSIGRISAGVKWVLLSITIPVIAIVVLTLLGYLSTENLVITLAPTIVLVGLEIFAVIYRRRET